MIQSKALLKLTGAYIQWQMKALMAVPWDSNSRTPITTVKKVWRTADTAVWILDIYFNKKACVRDNAVQSAHEQLWNGWQHIDYLHRTWDAWLQLLLQWHAGVSGRYELHGQLPASRKSTEVAAGEVVAQEPWMTLSEICLSNWLQILGLHVQQIEVCPLLVKVTAQQHFHGLVTVIVVEQLSLNVYQAMGCRHLSVGFERLRLLLHSNH